jgi:hypothetical protein
MTFLLPLEFADPEARPGLEMAEKGARASGTPFISFFTPSEMLTLARDAAFKQELLQKLAARTAGEHQLIDLGGDGSDPEDDYPDYAQRQGYAVQQGHAESGILVCG